MRDVDRVVDAEAERDRQRDEVEEVDLEPEQRARRDHQQRAGGGRDEHRDARAGCGRRATATMTTSPTAAIAVTIGPSRVDRREDVGEDHARARGRDGLAVGEVERAHRAREPDQVVAVPLVELVAGPDRDHEADPAILLGRACRASAGGRSPSVIGVEVVGRAQLGELGALLVVERVERVVVEQRADLGEHRELCGWSAGTTSRIESIEPIVCCSGGLPASTRAARRRSAAPARRGRRR